MVQHGIANNQGAGLFGGGEDPAHAGGRKSFLFHGVQFKNAVSGLVALAVSCGVPSPTS